jgi:hypothetical protein
MEWASAYDTNGTDWGTNTPSPFAGAMADEKSWLNGHVPGYNKLQEVMKSHGGYGIRPSWNFLHNGPFLHGVARFTGGRFS